MQRRVRGFTLVELMVAIAVLAVMGSMSWLGLDALLRSRSAAQAHATETAALQVVLSQWAADLDQSVGMDGLEPMGWDGKVFRLTRRSTAPDHGLLVAAWTVRMQQGTAQLMRWQSRPVASVAQWRAAWQDAAIWARSGAQTEAAVELLAASEMDVALWSQGAWVNAQSSQTAEPGTRRRGVLGKLRTVTSSQPMGVKLKLRLHQGVLEKDWVSPLWTVNRS